MKAYQKLLILLVLVGALMPMYATINSMVDIQAAHFYGGWIGQGTSAKMHFSYEHQTGRNIMWHEINGNLVGKYEYYLRHTGAYGYSLVIQMFFSTIWESDAWLDNGFSDIFIYDFEVNDMRTKDRMVGFKWRNQNAAATMFRLPN